MAIYQFVCELIPKPWALENIQSINKYLEDGMYDLSSAWMNMQYNEIYGQSFSEILEKNESWNNEIRLWGSETENDIQVIVDKKNNIEGVTIRIDVRDVKEEYLTRLISLANYLNCYFFLPEFKKIIPPDLSQFYYYIQESSANRFVSDPDKFFKSIKNRD